MSWDTTADICTVQSATPGPIPEGTLAAYAGPAPTNKPSCEVILVTPSGATATGRCIYGRTGPGTCTFAWGTGLLAGFHAILQVTTSPDGRVNWEGTYYFGPVA